MGKDPKETITIADFLETLSPAEEKQLAQEMGLTLDKFRKEFEIRKEATEKIKTGLPLEKKKKGKKKSERPHKPMYALNMPWAFVSCEVGQKGGLAESVSERLGGITTGYEESSNLNKIKVQFGFEGRIMKVTVFPNEGKAGTYQNIKANPQ